jgi:hypothetical protein
VVGPKQITSLSCLEIPRIVLGGLKTHFLSLVGGSVFLYFFQPKTSEYEINRFSVSEPLSQTRLGCSHIHEGTDVLGPGLKLGLAGQVKYGNCFLTSSMGSFRVKVKGELILRKIMRREGGWEINVATFEADRIRIRRDVCERSGESRTPWVGNRGRESCDHFLDLGCSESQQDDRHRAMRK